MSIRDWVIAHIFRHKCPTRWTQVDVDPEDKLLDVAGEYLKSKDGVNPVVIGGISIQHRSGDLQHNHELVIQFTGKVDYPEEATLHGR
jgi:hypothetical protein